MIVKGGWHVTKLGRDVIKNVNKFLTIIARQQKMIYENKYLNKKLMKMGFQVV